MVKIYLPLFLAALVLVSCGSNINNKDAVKKGVLDYLDKRKQQTGLDMSLMNVEVTNVAFEKNEARATVAFVPKGAAGGAMTMTYVLERRGSQWVVRGRQESGGPHGAGGMPPGGAMPPGAGMQGGGANPHLPSGHPPVNPEAGKDQKQPDSK